MTKKDDGTIPQPKDVINLDALADKPSLDRRSMPRRSGLSLREVSELNKKDPSQLTQTQKRQLAEVNRQIRDAITPMLPQLKEAMSVSKHVAEVAQEALSNFKLPDLSRFVIEPPTATIKPYENFVMPAIIPPASSTEQVKQTRILERVAQAFEEQNAERDIEIHQAIRPTYDNKNRLLIFANTLIPIPDSSDQEELCKSLFYNGKPVKKPQDLGDVLENMGVPLDRIKGNKKVNSAKQALNDRVEKATQIKELFIISDRKVWFNKKYL